MIKKIEDWHDAFMKPLDFEFEFEIMPDEIYDAMRCYPPIIDRVSARQRQNEGYFFDDEVNESNAKEVRFLRVRSVTPWVDIDPYDELMEEERIDEAELLKMAIRDRTANADPVPFIVPGYDLPNLEKFIGDIKFDKASHPVLNRFDVIGNVEFLNFKNDVMVHNVSGDVKVTNSDVKCLVLSECDQLVSDGSCLVFGSLREASGVSMTGSKFCLDELHKTGSMELRHCSMLKDNALGSLESASNIKIDNNVATRFILPKLKEVSSWICIYGRTDLDCPQLEKALGVEQKSTGTADFPVLREIGLFEPSSARSFGSLEVVSGSVNAPCLERVSNEVELCYGTNVSIPKLKEVGGSLFVGVGAEICRGNLVGIERKAVSDHAVVNYKFDHLKSVGGLFDVADKTFVTAPKCRTADRVRVGRGSLLKAPCHQVKKTQKM